VKLAIKERNLSAVGHFPRQEQWAISLIVTDL